MKRRSFLCTTLGLGVLGALSAAGPARGTAALTSPPLAPAGQWRQRLLLGFGSKLTLRAAHPDGARAEAALDVAVGTLRAIEAQMSLFRSDSALARLNREGVLHAPPPDLVAVLQSAQAISARSGGTFDVTVQPLWDAFAAARRAGRLPSSEAIGAARARVGWAGLQVSAERIRFLRPGMGITLNGIAQGFAADRVRAELQRFGIAQALVNTGEWTALGHSEGGRAWTLGIADPRDAQALVARLAMDGRAIATSADNESAFSDDFRHHHIFDPKTGYSPPQIASVTVAADSCALADALTKVIFVKGVTDGLAEARAWKVDALIVDKAGQWHATDGLKTL